MVMLNVLAFIVICFAWGTVMTAIFSFPISLGFSALGGIVIGWFWPMKGII